MSSETPLSSSTSSSVSSTDDRTKLGNVIELVHMIGSHLEKDDDYQSLTRMSAACKAYKEDFSTWIKKRGDFYRSTDIWEVMHLGKKCRRFVQ